jgi:hypothetical protein
LPLEILRPVLQFALVEFARPMGCGGISVVHVGKIIASYSNVYLCATPLPISKAIQGPITLRDHAEGKQGNYTNPRKKHSHAQNINAPGPLLSAFAGP